MSICSQNFQLTKVHVKMDDVFLHGCPLPLISKLTQIESPNARRFAVALTLSGVFISPSAAAQVSGVFQTPLADTTRSDENLLGEELLPKGSGPLIVIAEADVDDQVDSQANPPSATDVFRPGTSQRQQRDAFTRATYIGVGFGQSFLAPDSNDVSAADILEDTSDAWQLAVGGDINPWLSMELHATDLGEAELSDNSAVGFRDYGLSALWYFGQNRAAYHRKGFTVFGRTGIGYLSASTDTDVSLDNSEGLHWVLGAGLEYSMSSGLAIRAEGIAHGPSANHVQLGLLYRFGGLGSWFSRIPVIGDFTSASRQRKARMSGSAERVSSANDVDGDGVLGDSDKCPDTPASIAVGENGCALFNGVIDGLTFKAGSSELSPDAVVVLQSVANSLLQSPKARARVAAHTDSLGEADANMLLSRQRAFEVAKFLVQSGVSKLRLEARAFGETRPIDSNSTEQGRRNNRRVEIDLIAE